MWRNELTKDIHAHYVVDLDSILKQLDASMTPDGFIELRFLDQLAREELIHVAQYSIAAMEYVGAKMALISKVITVQKQVGETKRAELTRTLSETERDASGKALGDNKLRDLVKGHPELREHTAKLAAYEAYGAYLERLVKFLDNLQFLSKSMTSQPWRSRE